MAEDSMFNISKLASKIIPSKINQAIHPFSCLTGYEFSIDRRRRKSLEFLFCIKKELCASRRRVSPAFNFISPIFALILSPSRATAITTHWGFFPLWLGYSLFIDALVYARKKSSLLTRNPARYIGLFLISAPAWWIFELINLRTQNWFYDGRQYFSDIEYFLLASLSFSTVMPAVFGTAELFSTFNWIQKYRSGLQISDNKKILFRLVALGIFILSIILIFPAIFYPFIWIALIFIVDPINRMLNNVSLIQCISMRNWTPVLSLMFGSLACGFFWEMWNFYSYPKWKYYLPYVNFAHLFEMPVPGYIGYLPFALELFALYNFVTGLLKMENKEYIHLKKTFDHSIKYSNHSLIL